MLNSRYPAAVSHFCSHKRTGLWIAQRIILLAITLCTSNSLFSSHISGGEFHWECQGYGLYRLGLTLHRDCEGATMPSTQSILLESSCMAFTMTLNLTEAIETSQLCAAQLPNSRCNGGPLPGTQQYTYSAMIQLPTCGVWTFSYTSVYRNEAVVNIVAPGNKATYIKASLNSSTGVCQDSPLFLNRPIPFVCFGEPVLYSFGVTDPIGDALSYHLVSALGAGGNNIPYVAPNSGAVPIPGIVLDPESGEVQFTPLMQGNWVVVVRVDRHDANGNVIASVLRDMQFVVYPCGNEPPDAESGLITNVTGSATQTGPRAVTLCPNGSFCFDFSISDPNASDVLTMSNNIAQALPGATFTTSGTNPVTMTVCWTPDVPPGIYSFQVTANDNACPILAMQTYVYSVRIRQLPVLTFDSTPTTCPGALNGTLSAIPPPSGAPYSYAWSVPGDDATITGGVGSYNVVATDVFGCSSNTFTGSISAGPSGSATITGPSSSCGANSFQLQGQLENASNPVWSASGGTFTGSGNTVSYTPSLENVLAGEVTITLSVSGGLGCPPITSTHVVELTNSFNDIAVATTPVTCSGGNNGSAALSPVHPDYNYSWSYGSSNTGPSITGLPAGEHSVTIADPSGCEISIPFVISEPEPFTVEVIYLAHASCAGEGYIQVDAVGGTAPYTFSWSNGTTGNSMEAAPGTYSVWATDNTGCNSNTLSLALNEGSAPPLANAGEDFVSCSGGLPITLQGSVTNAQLGAWSGGTGSFSGNWPNVQYMPSLAEIQNGGVQLTLTTVGSTECPQASDVVWIDLPNSFGDMALTGTDASCNGALNGSATISGTQPGFIHIWSHSATQSGAVVNGLGAGPISVQIIDPYGCDTTLHTVIGEPEALGITDLLVTHEGCAGDGDGNVVASVAGGTAAYEYAWSNGSSASQITASAGTWVLTVTDANGCTAQESATILAMGQPNAADAGGDRTVCVSALPVMLNGNVSNASSGSWSGGSGSFSGTWPAIQYMPSASEIQAGTVQLSLTTVGNSPCPSASDSMILTLSNSFAGATITTTDALCNGSSTGTASIQSNAIGPQFIWNDPEAQTSATAIGLQAGSYTVTVGDASGCDTTMSITIGEPVPLAITALVVTNELCSGDANGSISASVTGGTFPYSFAWSNGASTASISVGAGTWDLVVTDLNGCSVQGSATVSSAAGETTADAGPDAVHCQSGQAIALNGSVTNATAGSWSGGSGTFLGTWPTLSYLPSNADVLNGSVELVLNSVVDGCPPVTDTVLITLSNAFLNASLSATHVLCHGSAEGSIGFTPHFAGNSYLWNDLATQTTATATGLPAGSYTVVATDAFGCDTTMSISILEPEPLLINALLVTHELCAGDGNGSISASVAGGVLPYSYAWSNGASTASISVGAGTWDVIVTDNNGCSMQGSATVNTTARANTADAGPDLVTCQSDQAFALHGSVTNAAGGSWSGGTGTFLGSWPTVSYLPSNTDVINGGAELVLTTQGSTGCPPATDTLHISISNAFINASLAAVDPLCHGAADGSIAFTPQLPGNSYLWNDAAAQTTATATGLNAGTYTLIISDALGCDTVMTATVQQTQELVVTEAISHATTCNSGNDGSATLIIEGGTPTYSVTWNNGSTGASITGLAAGSYTATVSDAHGCTTEATATVEEPAAIMLEVSAPDTVCINIPVEFSASAHGGTGGLVMNWGNLGIGELVQSSFNQSQTVQLTVTDAVGCTAPVMILPITVLDLNSSNLVTYGDTLVCTGGTAQVRAELFNYPGQATFVWPQLGAFGKGPFSIPVNQSMDIVVQVTDQCSAMLQGAVELKTQSAPNLELDAIIAEGCAPLNVAFPDLTEGGTWLPHWTLGNGETSTLDAPVALYEAGTYAVQLTLTSALGCQGTTMLEGTVVAHAAPEADFSATAWSVDMNTPITFTAESSADPVNYQWSFDDGGNASGAIAEHIYRYPGTYEVLLHVVDGNGCSTQVLHTVEIANTHELVLPNAFTPSPLGGNGGVWIPGDLSNDVFYAFAVDVADFNMRIHNRWGELIFESTDLSIGWDGFYLGQLSPQDVYMVQTYVRFKDGQQIQKHTDLTLFR